MSDLVFIGGGQVRASSRDVAASFEKEHRHVLRSVDQLIDQEPATAAHFWAAVDRQHGEVGKELRYFEMDRDGFSLLAMGFTGPKALKWKLAYIEAFNSMERALAAPADDEPVTPTNAPALPDDIEKMRLGLSLVREARLNFGPTAARRAWALVGLPDVQHGSEPSRIDHSPGAIRSGMTIIDWLNERCELLPGVSERTGALFADYQAWAKARGESDVANMRRFADFLTARGFYGRKSDGVWRQGVRLQHS